MQAAEKVELMDDAPENLREAVTQLNFAYQRSEAVLSSDQDAMAEAVRRAEAILFVAGAPLSAEQIAEVLPQGIEAADVLMALKADYAGRGINLVEVAGKWRFQSAADLEFLFVEEREVQKKLSQAASETLAIIAYGQPVTRAEIEAVRGVAVSKGTIDTLMETGWVKIKGRRKTPGQPITYGTTDLFLEHFGLESLDTLPGKADLEAEGLLSDVIPDSFQMPDEVSDEDGLDADHETDETETSFVTDFMDDAEEADAETTPQEDAGAQPVADLDAALSFETEEETEDSDFSLDQYRTQAEADTTDEADEDAVESAVIALAKATRHIESPTALSARDSIAEDDDLDDEKPDWESW